MRLIEPLWIKYKNKTVGSGTPPIMAIRYKKAFYSGVGALLDYLQSLPKETPEETADQIIRIIREEIQRLLTGRD